MRARYRSEAEKIAMRQTFASLARTDHLTGLANRLAFGEAFAREVETHGAKRIAVHCLDLDRFKPVNDRLGHPAGDDLLRQVADRLRSLCRNGNSAGRLGGGGGRGLKGAFGAGWVAMSSRCCRRVSAIWARQT